MNKQIKQRMITGLLAMMIVHAACTQSHKMTGADDDYFPSPALAVSKPADITTADIPYRNNINMKAMRHFRQSYAGCSEEKWYTIKNGYMVKCVVDGNRTRVDYDHKGQWLCTISYYEEEKLPRTIRALVKSTWLDYSIVLVEQLDFAKQEAPVYVVHIQYKDDWKKIRVHNGEIDEMK